MEGGLHERRSRAALAGHQGDRQAAEAAAGDPDPSVRLLGYGALARLGALTEQHITAGFSDADSRVVRRVIEAVARIPRPVGDPSADSAIETALETAIETAIESSVDSLLLHLLNADDTDEVVAETAAWALGERHQQTEDGPVELTPEAEAHLVDSLSRAATQHPDALVRESAAAALGAIGRGLPAILVATTDKATVRRRAVLALASFDTPEVTDALHRARQDRDWQVRQAAEDLLREQ